MKTLSDELDWRLSRIQFLKLGEVSINIQVVTMVTVYPIYWDRKLGKVSINIQFLRLKLGQVSTVHTYPGCNYGNRLSDQPNAFPH